ncbi:MAG: hypothetical protein AAGE90_07090, partial [Pseudomonadota bacterium]
MSTTIQTDNIAGQDYSNYDWSSNDYGEAGDAGDVEAAIDEQVVSQTCDDLVDAANSGELNGYITEFESQSQGDSFAGEDYSDKSKIEQIATKAMLLSSDEIQTLADQGRITQKQADYLKVLGGIGATISGEKGGSMLTAYDSGRIYDSMVNFANQDSASKSDTITAFDSRQVERGYSWSLNDDNQSIHVSNVWAEPYEPSDEAKAATTALGSDRNWDDLINNKAIERFDSIFDEHTLGAQYSSTYEQYARTLYKELGSDGLQAAVDAGKMSQGTADYINMNGQYYEETHKNNYQGIAYTCLSLSDSDRQFVLDKLAEGGDAKDGMIDFLSPTLTELGNAGGIPSNMEADRLRWYIDDGRNQIYDTIQNGGTPTDAEMTAFLDNVSGISPDDIQAQVPDSLSQAEADWLITATGVAATNPSLDDFSTAMQNFNAASDWAQDAIATAYKGRTVDSSIFADCENNDFGSATLMPEQHLPEIAVKATDMLINATADTVDGVPELIGNEEVDDTFGLDDENQISREEMEQLASNNIDDFDDLSDATKDLIVDNLMLFDNPNPDVQLNSDSYVVQPKLDENGEQVVDDDGNPVFEVKPGFLTPDDIRSRDVQDADDAGQSYFQCSVNVLTES